MKLTGEIVGEGGFVFFSFEADRYPSASIGETAVAILTGFLLAEKIVNPTSRMVASKTVG